MTNWIQHFHRPAKMFLAWQAPDHMNDRFRWAVGELTVERETFTLRYFRNGDEFSSLNDGKNFDELKQLGYDGHPAFAIKKEIHTQGVGSVFQNRLPPVNRPDFLDYKAQFRIGASVDLSLESLLAITEAKLPSDGFSVVDPLDAKSTDYDLMLEVAGYRYYANEVTNIIGAGRAVEIRRELENPHDPNAIQFLVEGRKIGNLNRLQTKAFGYWLDNAEVSGVIERLNGRRGHPRAFVFVRVRALKAASAA